MPFDLEEDFRPIDESAKDGRRKIVRRGPEYARAKWTGSMWAYDFGPDQDAWHQIDFEPTHYRELADA
jgi:hypothetical protein